MKKNTKIRIWGALWVLLLSAGPALAVDADLSWTDNATNEDGFRVQRKLNGTALSTIEIVGANIVTFKDQSLVQDKFVNNVYCFAVSAFNTGGDSSLSNEGCKTVARAAPDGAPNNLTVK